jgi:hypothetical protein
MAKFLQETIAETGTTGLKSAEAAKEFAEFFRKVNYKYLIILLFEIQLTFFLNRFVLLESKLVLKTCFV